MIVLGGLTQNKMESKGLYAKGLLSGKSKSDEKTSKHSSTAKRISLQFLTRKTSTNKKPILGNVDLWTV
nr:MAG TPA: hypothetical protein [Inoviridae sp.]